MEKQFQHKITSWKYWKSVLLTDQKLQVWKKNGAFFVTEMISFLMNLHKGTYSSVKIKINRLPLAGRRQPATVLTRGQVSAWLGRRPQPQQQQSPSWFRNSTELRNLVCTGESLHHRSWQFLGTAKATQLLRKVLFWDFFFGQEEVQTQDICAPSL